MVNPYIKSGSRILDVGGYTGDLIPFVKKGVGYFIVDADRPALQVARKKGARVKQVFFDEEEISFNGVKKFDAIICTETLEHLKDPKRHVDTFKALLKEDGILVISMPNENSIYHRIMVFLGFGVDSHIFELYKHLHFPTVSQILKFLGENFEIIKVDYYINPSGAGSRFSFLGKVFMFLPDDFWYFLARFSPSLFARGVVVLCKLKVQPK